ncbi:glycoside hydrolase family 140 protein [Paenibacillus gansuensis]|uniref:Glycoside hydrolase family 140 protein n=1 Tax=Paenibacillus gansuensis TaxID=306542 RepID=A0ABW5PC64_9BACL
MDRACSNLSVSDNGRYLVKEDGTPFFWLGDTAWELFHKLTREEADFYLRRRAEQGFTVVQAVALAEMEGITEPNAYGYRPLKQNAEGQYDPLLPDTASEPGGEDYWTHVDDIVDRAASLGIYIAFLPTWGDKYNVAWGKGPVIFDRNNAKAFGKWLGERYRDRSNLLWVVGGDRPLTEFSHFEVNRGLAEGLREGDGGRHLITFHPPGGFSSSHHVHRETWLDFNMIQSGHGDHVQNNYTHVMSDYGKLPVKPTLDAEPCYEDHPRGFNAENGYFDDADVRKAAYYALFSGAFGHTYGHHSIWAMTTEPADYFIMHWKDAVDRPGAMQMRFVRELIESKPQLERVPDQSLLADNYKGANHMRACRGEGYAWIYSPHGLNMNVAMGRIAGTQVHASWFNPRTGERTAVGIRENAGTQSFQPPSSGRGDDWVLVLDTEAAG